MKAPITSFSGKYRFLSNFYAVKIVYDGIVYPSVEHAYQAQKCVDQTVRLKIASLPTAGKAKFFGRNVAMIDGWNDVKFAVMYSLVLQKFQMNPWLGKRLDETGNAELIEGNTWGDIIWGMTRDSSGEWTGHNMLGKTLMEVRKFLREDA